MKVLFFYPLENIRLTYVDMINIKEVKTDKDLKDFINFNYSLYEGNEYAVPELMADLLTTFSRTKNAAYDFSESRLFLAVDSTGEVVGRVAAIINHKANETWGIRKVRFGWIDFVDDYQVSSSLINAVEQWGREKGMDSIQGPMGFTDMDHEGMLIEGFDELSTSATIYNYPYYQKHLEALGFEKEADWIEYSLKVPEKVPEKLMRIAEIVKQKYDLHLAPRNISTKSFLARYGSGFFSCVNEAFKPLFGYSEITERQKTEYLKMYSSLLDRNLISVVLDKDERVVGCGAAMPSMSRALQKSRGKMFPFGWWHLVKALKWKHSETADLLLAAVIPEYQGKGVNAIFVSDIVSQLIIGGYKQVESNVELETNSKIQSQWNYFEHRQHKRRRCYTKTL